VRSTEDVWAQRYRGIWPTYQQSGVATRVRWDEVADTETAYALGRCRAYLKAVGFEAGEAM
jgi:hypothetical protein